MFVARVPVQGLLDDLQLDLPQRLRDGTHFAVWAPNASRVSVIGNFNGWDGRHHVMRLHPGNGIWEIFLPGVGNGALYKYEIQDRDGKLLEFCDFAIVHDDTKWKRYDFRFTANTFTALDGSTVALDWLVLRAAIHSL